MEPVKQKKEDVELGRFLSLVLRHNPSAANISLDAHGWADVEALISGVTGAGKRISKETLERIVKENNKKRYCFNNEHTKIRASQGHSVYVDLELKPCMPPDLLYHGTAKTCLKNIYINGIQKQSRQHVHLSVDIPTALTVGGRHGVPVILEIDTKAMVKDGYEFYQADNGVWLCEQIPWKYCKIK